ncbi:hypothetical protein [Leptospira mtsangambouensis]|uniref:hypothetical protein n=1 Tax=Leptospira mtsangambouensis TaxID=2484912 RepID=UPI001EEB4E85|nr:hypothetical protein [Leptospira mtsangambouensis]MCG6141360.1 hypothetical protein [Leptospira mtsangambouensis]
MRYILFFSLIICFSCKTNDSIEEVPLAALSILTIQNSDSGIYIYSLGSPINAVFGDRSTTDTLCTNRKSDPSLASRIKGNNSKAFVSYSSSDEIRDFPENYSLPVNLPIRAPNNVIIANNWRDFMDGDLAITMTAANIIRDSSVSRIWTFSNINGAFNSTFNCGAGTSTVGNGAYWNMSTLVYTMDVQLCTNTTSLELLCLSY